MMIVNYKYECLDNYHGQRRMKSNYLSKVCLYKGGSSQ